MKGYENRLKQSRREPGSKGFRALHESAGVSFGARSRKKLTGKSNWFKSKKKISSITEDTEENEVPTVPTLREQRKAERISKKDKKRKGNKTKKEIITTSVMFVENTPHGELCARMQRSEDRNGEITNRRVKMVEMAGTSLGQTFSNRNPWAGAGCSREDCHSCNQGGKQDKKEDCFRRNILYESRCGVCEDRREMAGDTNMGKKRKRMDLSEPNIYVGETSRSLYERTKEHIRDGQNRAEDSHIAKHWEQVHGGEEMPEFRFRIVRSFKDSLSRQVAESIRIDLRGEQVLNSRTVYSRNRLPRLEVEKPEWEKVAEEKWKKAAETKQREKQADKERQVLGERQSVQDEEMMTEVWRKRYLEIDMRTDWQYLY